MRTEIHDLNIGSIWVGSVPHDDAVRVSRLSLETIVMTEHTSCAERLQFVADYNARALALGSQRIDITRIL